MQHEPFRAGSTDRSGFAGAGKGARAVHDASIAALQADLSRCLSSADLLGLDFVAIHIDMAINRLATQENA